MASLARVLKARVVGQREFQSPEVAADHLIMLLKMDGWDAPDDVTRDIFLDGRPIEHKGLTYKITEKEQ